MSWFNLAELKSETKKIENKFNLSLKPRTIDEFIGCENIKKIIKISISAAKNSGLLFGHTLLVGPRGMGKTTLAELICKEMSAEYKLISGRSIRNIADLNSLMLFSVPDNGFLIIDEIHGIDTQISDLLHSCMDDFTYTYTDAKHRAVTIDTPVFNLIGCTTEEGRLSPPFYSRFRKKFYLEPYSALQVQSILMGVARNNKIIIDSAAAYEIATRSQNTPRIGLLHLINIYEYAIKNNKGKIDSGVVSECMQLHGLDDLGLNPQQRAIINVLDSSPLGVENIAARTNLSTESITAFYEPYLLQIGLIERTPRGRVLTAAGRKYKSAIRI